MLSLFSIGSIIISICAALALIFLIRDKSPFWKIITLGYMVIVLSTELFAKYIGRLYHSNIVVYNIYTIIELTYITYAFYYFLKEFRDIKKLIVPIYIFIMAIYIGFTLTHDIVRDYNSITVSIMSVVFVIYGLLYFYLLLKDEKYIDLKFHPAFWWVGGAIIFYFGGTLANFFNDVIQQKFLGKYNTRHIIYTTLNILLYGFWSYSFICRARQRTICP
ncbi:hypothetical protein QWY86_12385 [Pedobacter aquatilis]|uniref:hypothetical protein n=1 Tax=Pedobacter aquatilis TaxID=351343 RepID=UPI0025B54E13|nr:hypothetical protein [Pedobacter aquatilis]MDN3587474.1 hypothetical protein [Pedobacter aquatilis]